MGYEHHPSRVIYETIAKVVPQAGPGNVGRSCVSGAPADKARWAIIEVSLRLGFALCKEEGPMLVFSRRVVPLWNRRLAGLPLGVGVYIQPEGEDRTACSLYFAANYPSSIRRWAHPASQEWLESVLVGLRSLGEYCG